MLVGGNQPAREYFESVGLLNATTKQTDYKNPLI